MSYLVICTFDLKGADYEDYQNAYADLGKIGLKRIMVRNNGGKSVIPITTVGGEFNGTAAGPVVNYLLNEIKTAFAMRGFSSEIFISTGENWAWNSATT